MITVCRLNGSFQLGEKSNNKGIDDCEEDMYTCFSPITS